MQDIQNKKFNTNLDEHAIEHIATIHVTANVLKKLYCFQNGEMTPEMSLALTNLHQSVMWAVKAIYLSQNDEENLESIASYL